MNPENKIKDAAKMLVLTLSALAGFSFVPNANTGSIPLKKVNILSDLTRKKPAGTDILVLCQTFAQRENIPVDTSGNSSDSAGQAARIKILRSNSDPNIIPIEDFTADNSAMAFFYDALVNIRETGRPARIAFVGDSFIEGDILTSDLRELLQSRYGGRGVGFVPIAPIVKYRNTLRQDYSKWKTYTVNNPAKANPDMMIISGQYFVPEQGATISMISTPAKEHSAAYNRARLLFYTEDPANLKFGINNSESVLRRIEPADSLRMIEVEYPDITHLSCRFEEVGDFTGYGIFLEDGPGIYVDNFSLRSSTGINLLSANSDMLRQLNSLVKYDLVILQYGLNIAEPDKISYTSYKNKMVDVVNHLRQSMPCTSFMILGIGDSNRNIDGELKTPLGVLGMVETQKQIARETGAAFWNTYQAMGGQGGMSKFVQKRMANKDYTHINYAGGAAIAKSLANSIISQAYNY